MAESLFVQFCEDVRHEQFGKTSLMGLLMEQLYVNSIPITLPKLCINFCYDMSYAERPAQSLEAVVVLPDLTQNFPLPLRNDDMPVPDHGMIRFMGTIEMGNVQLNRSGEIIFKMIKDGKEFTTPFAKILVESSLALQDFSTNEK